MLATLTSRGKTHRVKWVGFQAIAMAMLGVLAASGTAFATTEEAADIWEALTKGTPTLNVRGRVELAKTESLERSEAYTVRTRLGYGTKPLYGMSMFVEMEHVGAIHESSYTPFPNGVQTVIPDPKGLNLNQAVFTISQPDWLGSKLAGGRQRIIYDDSRFVGNVGWRQNEQTFDALKLDTSFGVDKLNTSYSFVGHRNTVLGEDAQINQRTHLINVSYDVMDEFKPVVFAYLFEARDPTPLVPPLVELDNNWTIGFRADGDIALNDEMTIGYKASYAYQQDYNNDPVEATTGEYSANYVYGDLNFGYKPYGKLGGAFEMLGSDDGDNRFATPLATLHKFNGWADVFAVGPTANGGESGLQDIMAYIDINLPWELKAKFVYHHFRSDDEGQSVGNEYDAYIKRSFGKYVDVLAKGAYFTANSTDFAPPNALNGLEDVWRFWFDVVVKF